MSKDEPAVRESSYALVDNSSPGGGCFTTGQLRYSAADELRYMACDQKEFGPLQKDFLGLVGLGVLTRVMSMRYIRAALKIE